MRALNPLEVQIEEGWGRGCFATAMADGGGPVLNPPNWRPPTDRLELLVRFLRQLRWFKGPSLAQFPPAIAARLSWQV